ncbi:hypothetical protein IJ118_01295 [Candidatus Saccharibacteria bacterium]|nr:hypothetical protein [Candidatus Saccharibacteria bacterium]
MNRALINASSGIVQKPLRYVLYVRKSSEDAEALGQIITRPNHRLQRICE